MSVADTRSFRVVQVTKRHPHHGARAGYNRLLQALPADRVVWASETGWGRLVNGVTRRALAPVTRSTWYGLSGAWAELRGAAWARWHGATLIHVMYGEDLLSYLPHLAGSEDRVVATFHQPEQRIRALIGDRVWRRLDAAICLDETTAVHWETRLPGRTHRLSLGVDTDYWCPGSEARSEATCLFVGNHLRDFDLLDAAIRRLEGQARFQLVIPERRAARFVGRPGVEVFSGVSDEALRALYQRASLLFLPLLDGSANNSILQALACGLPIVTSNVAGIQSYTESSHARWAEKGDLEAHLAALTAMLADGASARERSAAARRRGLEFSWSRIAERHLDCYADIMADRRSCFRTSPRTG